jgi:hypothetical protein
MFEHCPMKCSTCHSELMQKNRARLFVVGVLMIGAMGLIAVVPYFWAPGIILGLTGIYLIIWATLGQGLWRRACKKFGVSAFRSH